ncbi:DUF1501 domain-containing protein [Kineococcus radiotolerans]|uniref:DUF1501 domain-containing protein n=1 Tax=Kineococcus radiotolerans (strain ATCC BAA-149 / DSM 14245 / SRS30216) TaxID=266940 RepID=A6WEV0_KINRD|nr:DUF1501 domain-containing protein [Kineococcus radiotolerans]ABS05339.1 protein of unknown function DUF1501 [Kineococcus radiotolerans SRS30216 = ATCC BAA-149]
MSKFKDDARCGCDEGSKLVSRRSVLRAALAAAAAGVTTYAVGDVSTQVSFAGTGWNGETLVVLSLHGGFDGLSAVVPGGDAGYYAARPNIAVPRSTLLGLDQTFGLHPAMAPLMPLWRNGTFGVVHAVGQAEPTRSHFAAMERMELAAPGSSVRTGWIDRTLGSLGTGSVLNAVGISNTPARAFAGPAQETTMTSLDGFSLIGPGDDRPTWHAALRRMHTGARPEVAQPASTLLTAMEDVAGLRGTASGPANGAVYPDSDLGRALAEAAVLKKSGAPVQVIALDYGDWDMHAGLGRVDGGWMRDKLTELSSALAAFATDLGGSFASTTLVTLSEFGRRVGENASGGLDHGHGNAVLLLGGGVVGGRVHGVWPGLGADRLVDGDLAGTTDYRSVIGEVLQKRCGAGSLSAIFPGFSGAPLGVVRSR